VRPVGGKEEAELMSGDIKLDSGVITLVLSATSSANKPPD
jgi:hypothetical protein